MPSGDRDLAATAHVLRRTSFGPFPEATEQALDRHGSPRQVLEAQLGAEPLPFHGPAHLDDPLDLDDEATGNEAVVQYWLRRMTDDDAGLHEKMMWFWHDHFPVSFMKSAGLYCWRMLRTFHRLALGNFAELTKAVCTDGAMLQYLDGAGSRADDPNENLARELMELFTLGRGHYTEDDVRAGARALAGYAVLPEEPDVTFDPGNALAEPVTFLGATATFDVDSLVDRILEQPSCAPFLVDKLARYLVGGEPDPDEVAAWAQLLRRTGYEIRPVVEAILRSGSFAAAERSRSKHGIEWLCSVVRIAELELPESRKVQGFGQVPFYPPNVAGWPDTWLSASSLYARAGFLYAADLDPGLLPDGDPASAALVRCGLYDVSASTRAAVRTAAHDAPDDRTAVLRAALLAPEFALA